MKFRWQYQVSVALSAALVFIQPVSAVWAAGHTDPKNGSDDGKNTKESTANTQLIPTQILKTGVVLNSTGMSPNSVQLAANIGLKPLLERIQNLRARIEAGADQPTLESLSARQDYWDARQQATLIIQRTNLDIDFAAAEIEAETQVYQEILATFTNDRDKLVARINAASFISNGILWAAAEAFDIPSFNTTFAVNPRKVVQWAIPSGTTGIAAGLVPSIASMYTLRAVNGKKKTSESDPNMLAKLFDYPTNPDIEYPKTVWQYLHEVPADSSDSKKRIDQIVDRWIADSNMPAFTDRRSAKQLDIITASVARKKGLSIATLTSRIVMLGQLHSEIVKMKRMLLELTMAVQGEKQLTALEPKLRSAGPDLSMSGGTTRGTTRGASRGASGGASGGAMGVATGDSARVSDLVTGRSTD